MAPSKVAMLWWWQSRFWGRKHFSLPFIPNVHSDWSMLSNTVNAALLWSVQQHLVQNWRFYRTELSKASLLLFKANTYLWSSDTSLHRCILSISTFEYMIMCSICLISGRVGIHVPKLWDRWLFKPVIESRKWALVLFIFPIKEKNYDY